MQFSLKWLFIAVAFVAVSLVALKNANELWLIGLRSAVVLSCLMAMVKALWSVGKERAFWSGYALVVVFYIGIQWVGLEPLTTKALSVIHAQLFRPVTEDLYPPIDPEWNVRTVVFMSPVKPDGTVVVTYIRPTRYRFIVVGDLILSILFGFLGGLIATAFYQRRLNQKAQAVSPPTSPAAKVLQ